MLFIAKSETASFGKDIIDGGALLRIELRGKGIGGVKNKEKKQD